MEIKYDDNIFGSTLTIEKLRTNDGKFHMFDTLEEVFGIVEPIFEEKASKDIMLDKHLKKVVLKVAIMLQKDHKKVLEFHLEEIKLTIDRVLKDNKELREKLYTNLTTIREYKEKTEEVNSKLVESKQVELSMQN